MQAHVSGVGGIDNVTPSPPQISVITLEKQAIDYRINLAFKTQNFNIYQTTFV